MHLFRKHPPIRLSQDVRGFGILQVFVLIVIFGIVALIIQSMINGYRANMKRQQLFQSLDLIGEMLNGSLINSVAALSYTISKCDTTASDYLNFPQNPIFCLCLKEKACLATFPIANGTPDGFPFRLYRSEPAGAVSAIAGGMVSFCNANEAGTCSEPARKAQYLDPQTCPIVLGLTSGNCVTTSASVGIPASYQSKKGSPTSGAIKYVTQTTLSADENTKGLFSGILFPGSFTPDSGSPNSMLLLPQNMARYTMRGERCTQNPAEDHLKYIERCPFSVDLRFKVVCSDSAASCTYAKDLQDKIHICYTVRHDTPAGGSPLAPLTNVKPDGACTPLSTIIANSARQGTISSGSSSSGSTSPGSGSSTSGTIAGPPTSSSSPGSDSSSSITGGGGSSSASSSGSLISAGYSSSAASIGTQNDRLAAGGSHTCEIREDNKVWCWGRNGSGELGDGTTINRYSPTQIPDFQATAVSAGNGHTCAIQKDTHTVWCWGANNALQLGDGTSINRYSPTQIVNGFQAKAVSVGAVHTCAIRKDSPNEDTVWCWGANNAGQLGNGTTQFPQPAPALIASDFKVKAISAGGNQTCVIRKDSLNEDTVWCWGENGTVYFGGEINVTPTQIQNSFKAKALSVGNEHACAIKYAPDASDNNSVWCWGSNHMGQIDNGGGPQRNTPTMITVSGLGFQATALSAGGNHTCTIRKDDLSVWCWGINWYGQLGNGSTSNSTPTMIPNGFNAKAISSGSGHTCAISMNESVWCWGDTRYGQVAVGTTTRRPQLTPSPIQNSLNAKVISAGTSHTCAIKYAPGTPNDHSVWCWGDNSSGQLGNGTPSALTPTLIPNGFKAKAIGAGTGHSCAIDMNDFISCWGSNASGQLGNGTTSTSIPTAIQNNFNAIAITAGGSHTCAIKSAPGASDDNSVWCWGNNSLGQLGKGPISTFPQSTPTAITNFKAKAISAGTGHTCAIAMDDSVWCWGKNNMGLLGITPIPTSPQSTPIQIPGGFKAKILGAGAFHTCVIRKDSSYEDTVWCWGMIRYGQSANGSPAARPQLTPLQIQDGFKAKFLSLGSYFTCAIRTSDLVSCWGFNSSGQLGTGSTSLLPATTPGGTEIFFKAKFLSLGSSHTCAISMDDSVRCWGGNSTGQLGDGTITDANAP